eukprot:366546-Chlamydomonas_euryale.AAC.7
MSGRACRCSAAPSRDALRVPPACNPFELMVCRRDVLDRLQSKPQHEACLSVRVGLLSWHCMLDGIMHEHQALASGYPYTVVRSTGMIDSTEGGPFLLEADQGDSISGYMGRDEVADVLVSALCMPEAANKTFEVRRYEADDAKRILAGGSMSRAQYLRMYLRLADDAHRWRVGLRPMPRPVPPPSPPSEDRTKAIVEQVAAVREKAASKDAPKKEAAKKETVAKEPVTADA